MFKYKTRQLLFLLMLVLTPLLMGMGSSGSGGSPGKIPIPAKKFTAIFIDQADVVTKVYDVSIEGGTFIEGKKGEGTFTIAFENIKYLNFLMSEGKLQCMINLHDGNSLLLLVNKSQKAYGRTPYGTLQILLSELKKMTITRPGK